MQTSVDTESTSTFKIRPSGAALGADVDGIDLRMPLTSAQAQAIEDAWAQHSVLRFRGQRGLTVEELVRFSSNFGMLDQRPVASQVMSEELTKLPPEITLRWEVNHLAGWVTARPCGTPT